MTQTHVTAPTLFVEANGIHYAYRRFGEETGVPILFMQHFRGGLDHWDPAITDGFGRDRQVILFDNSSRCHRGVRPLAGPFGNDVIAGSTTSTVRARH